MDKDMMDKVNEAMKVNGKRELSLDEMDMVSGGFNPKAMTADEKIEFNNNFLAITRVFGFDVASTMFMDATGYVTYAHTSHGHATTDDEKMKLILDNYWNFVDNHTGGYH